MPPTTTRLTHWDDLAGRTIAKAYMDGDAFVLELDGDSHAVFTARDPALAISAEREIGEGLTEDVADWAAYAGRRILSLRVPIFAADHGEKSVVALGFAEGDRLVLRARISAVPVVLSR